MLAMNTLVGLQAFLLYGILYPCHLGRPDISYLPLKMRKIVSIFKENCEVDIEILISNLTMKIKI